ncbi:phage BR0599 family protein [Jhaorihella thermophila]
MNWADTGPARADAARAPSARSGAGGLVFVAEMRSLAHVLDQPVGRSFQAGCDAVLGDTRCGIDLADPAWKGTGTVAVFLRDRAFSATGLSGFAAGLFTFGTLTWDSGANAGRSVEVERHEVATTGEAVITLLESPGQSHCLRTTPSPSARAATRAFATCRDRFANTANFRGFPAYPRQRHRCCATRQGKATTGSVLCSCDGASSVAARSRRREG